ncbi:hypothetical protein [Methylobacterium sp. SyP6R]|uniref:hypothetical protein n=1 Tax=Methylobacterium sp. SyP6R TaxID=2718876 RepID=UPI001F29BDDA|nr:hypothetical protein [Methylobacterium sp. SyP6R]MCF4129698.1 hypothetical protein [Methylobacterium sp. SyP6R]
MRNLDRALQLEWKTGDSCAFSLRNYAIDVDHLDEVGSTDNSTYRVEMLMLLPAFETVGLDLDMRGVAHALGISEERLVTHAAARPRSPAPAAPITSTSPPATRPCAAAAAPTSILSGATPATASSTTRTTVRPTSCASPTCCRARSRRSATARI